MNIHPDGRRGTGVNQGPDGGTDYPFAAPSADIRHLLADLYLHHRDAAAAPPLRLAWAFGLDKAVNGGAVADPDTVGTGPDHTPTHAVDLVIVDAADRVIFDSTAAAFYRGADFGPRLRLHEWHTASAVCRIAQHTAVADAADAALVAATIKPARGTLDERTNERQPARVDSCTAAPAPAARFVELIGGYNVDLTATPLVRGLRRVTRVVVAAAPGGGLGRAPGCTEAPPVGIRTLDRVPADAAGRFVLAATDCYWVRAHTTPGGPGLALTPARLDLGNDCTPCCPCSAFERVQHGVLRTWDDLETTAQVAAQLACRFRRQVDRWEAQRACRTAQAVHLNALPYDRYAEVAASVCNAAAACQYDVTLRVAVATSPAVAVAVVPMSGARTDGRGGVRPFVPVLADGAVAGTWAILPPRVAASIRFRLRFATADPPAPVAVTLTATAGALPGTAVQSFTVGA